MYLRTLAASLLAFSIAAIGVAQTATLHAGNKALPFTAKTTRGKTVSFPKTYRGKVVLLDFWATWCGPCMGEVPNVVASYKKYHSRGFEILGISLDRSAKDLPPVTKEKGMVWQQVCDAKEWQAKVARLYGVQAIPQAYLVDGSTGKILAEGDEIRGDGLAKAIKTALGKRGRAK